jgi:hypothetical protein
MKKSALSLVMMLVLALVAVVGVQAQETLTDGTPAQGEITDDAFAVEYTYEGQADQVIVIELSPVDVLANYNNPALVLRDPAGAELVRYDGFGKTTIFWQLPETGTYTIVATRTDDAAGTSVGEYTLTVVTPAELSIDTPVQDAVTSEETDYFVYRGDSAFLFTFARTGDYAPEFTVNTINTDFSPGRLDTVATVGGKSATLGSVGNVPGGSVYIIRVGQALLDLYFETVSADYAISLATPEE